MGKEWVSYLLSLINLEKRQVTCLGSKTDMVRYVNCLW